MAMNSDDASSTYDLFQKAHSLLSRQQNDVYKFRQVDKYKAFFESCFERISKSDKVHFEHACKNMIQAIEKAEEYGEINPSVQKTISKTKEKLSMIIHTIVQLRT